MGYIYDQATADAHNGGNRCSSGMTDCTGSTSGGGGDGGGGGGDTVAAQCGGSASSYDSYMSMITLNIQVRASRNCCLAAHPHTNMPGILTHAFASQPSLPAECSACRDCTEDEPCAMCLDPNGHGGVGKCHTGGGHDTEEECLDRADHVWCGSDGQRFSLNTCGSDFDVAVRIAYTGGPGMDACANAGCWTCLDNNGICIEDGRMSWDSDACTAVSNNVWCDVEFQDYLGGDASESGDRDNCGSSGYQENFEGIYLDPGSYEIYVNERQADGSFDVEWSCGGACEVNCGGVNYFCEGFDCAGGGEGGFNPFEAGMVDFIMQVSHG